MEFTMSGTVLTKDLFSADGQLVASRGQIVDLAFLKELAKRAPRDLRERPLHETPAAAAVLEAFDSPALTHLVGNEASRALVADTVTEVRFPDPIWDEVE